MKYQGLAWSLVGTGVGLMWLAGVCAVWELGTPRVWATVALVGGALMLFGPGLGMYGVDADD